MKRNIQSKILKINGEEYISISDVADVFSKKELKGIIGKYVRALGCPSRCQITSINLVEKSFIYIIEEDEYERPHVGKFYNYVIAVKDL